MPQPTRHFLTWPVKQHALAAALSRVRTHTRAHPRACPPVRVHNRPVDQRVQLALGCSLGRALGALMLRAGLRHARNEVVRLLARAAQLQALRAVKEPGGKGKLPTCIQWPALIQLHE